jgi:hypothetical protein
MTTVFEEWVTAVNHKLKKESWKIALFGNSAAHCGTPLGKIMFLLNVEQ